METNAIKQLKSRMDELSVIRPVTMASLNESIRLENELVDLEVKECEKHNWQRAYQPESHSTFRDGLADQLQLLIDQIANRTTHVIFVFSRTRSEVDMHHQSGWRVSIENNPTDARGA